MKKIFAGMAFVFLNFNFNLPSSIIGLTPSFIGYTILLAGLTELSGVNRRFAAIRSVVMAALVYSAIIYVLDLVGATLIATASHTMALGLVSSGFSLFISYGIIIGIKDIERENGLNLESAPLHTAWKVWVVFTFVMYSALFFPALTVLFVLIAIILALYFLSKLRRTSNLFYSYGFVASDTPKRIGNRAVILTCAAVIIGCSGAFVYGRNATVFRMASACGQLQVTYHRVSGVLTYSSSLSNNQPSQRHVDNPEFIWSPCGSFLAVNSDTHWGSRHAEIIDLQGAIRMMPNQNRINDLHEETQMPASTTHNNIIVVEEWLDSENLLFTFSWPYFSAANNGASDIITTMHNEALYMSDIMTGWFTFHFPTWTITELVITHP